MQELSISISQLLGISSSIAILIALAIGALWSIYFNRSMNLEDLDTIAIHECLHYIQESNAKAQNNNRLGIAILGKEGMALNEAAVQLMASEANKEKEDIWIKVGKEKKSISIKMGKANTVHNEYIYNFTNYLAKEKVPLKIINIILEYFFADGTHNGSGARKLTFTDYKLKIKMKAVKFFISTKIIWTFCLWNALCSH